MMLTALAYRPFIDPIGADRWWYLLLIPLARRDRGGV